MLLFRKVHNCRYKPTFGLHVATIETHTHTHTHTYTHNIVFIVIRQNSSYVMFYMPSARDTGCWFPQSEAEQDSWWDPGAWCNNWQDHPRTLDDHLGANKQLGTAAVSATQPFNEANTTADFRNTFLTRSKTFLGYSLCASYVAFALQHQN